MKHVIVLNQFALPRTEGGGTRHIDLFARVNGWEPLIIAGNRNHYTQEGIRARDRHFRFVTVPPQRGGAAGRLLSWIFYAVQAFLVSVTRRNLDVVYGSSPQPLAALAGLLASRVRRVPFVLEVRDLWPESIVAAGRLSNHGIVFRLFSALEKLLATQASSVVCVTAGWEAHFAALGVDYDRLVVIPNGTELSDFTVSTSKTDLRKSYGISGFTAVFAGAHGPKDGIDLILDAAANLPDVGFILVGSGSAKKDAISRAGREELNNVQFRSPIPKKDLASLLRACDVGIHAVTPLPVFEKGMSPNKLFDYMAAGLPIVSNAAVGIERVTFDGECGRVGRGGDLVSCLRDVMTATEDQRGQWGLAGAGIIQRRYSRSAAATLLEHVLNGATSEESRSAQP